MPPSIHCVGRRFWGPFGFGQSGAAPERRPPREAPLMTTLADLHRAVQSTLASKRLGRPVFVRYLLCSRDKAEAALPRLAQLTAAVRDWLGQPLERVHAAGTPRGGQVS